MVRLLCFGRPAALAQSRRLQLHPACAERFAQQAFDLSINAAQLGRGAALNRSP